MLHRQISTLLLVSSLVLVASIRLTVVSISLGEASVTLRVAYVLLLSLMELCGPYAGTRSWTLFRKVSETQAPETPL
jgi:hypothetical protein